MKKNLIIALVAVVLVVGGIVLYMRPGGQGYAPSATPTTKTTTTNTASGKQKFPDSEYAQNAYLISTDTYTAETQQALSGFKVDKKTQADGSQVITLDAQKAEYTTQVFTVKPGMKLYFIERSLGDDGDNQDAFLGDDHAILVDADGYIVP